ncbi:hypothetical protein [Haliangium sp. UPWRP_2]|uniref:hypothetical protein n=1 Tax=Haliangium sp. UPWRP_2 TaxID=1931276 RepID=UPI000B53E72E|nr:hypothetical protein [Haliangium sp. UPWRP_2]PSM31515.1 hypothetical protein BVG81_004970 [Haliangium sp. UPWRP_2]
MGKAPREDALGGLLSAVLSCPSLIGGAEGAARPAIQPVQEPQAVGSRDLEVVGRDQSLLAKERALADAQR